MPLVLTTPYSAPPAPTRIVFDNVEQFHSQRLIRWSMTLTSAAGTNQEFSRVTVEVRNGACDKVSRGSVASGGTQADLLALARGALSLPTGYDDAAAAVRAAANNLAAVKQALETWALSVGVIDSTLAGT